jgi:prevent-host-death family protein
MKQVRIAELKARLSEYLRAVRQGETIAVLDRETPVAEIVPVRARATLRVRKPAPGTPPPNRVPLAQAGETGRGRGATAPRRTPGASMIAYIDASVHTGGAAYYCYFASLTKRTPTWLPPVLISPLPRVPTM